MAKPAPDARKRTRQRQVLYSLIFFDAIRIKGRDEGTVRNNTIIK